MEHVEDTGYKPIWQPFVDKSLELSEKLEWAGALILAGAVTGLYLMYRTSRETRRAAQASLLSQILSEYASPEMTAAMRGLYRWKEDHPEDFAGRFADLYRNREPEADALDAHRRYAYRFFDKITRLRESGLIDPKLSDLVAFASVGGRFLLDVLEPLQEAHGREISKVLYDKKLFDHYRRTAQALDSV